MIRLRDSLSLDKMNKRGMLLASETLKIVVAAICIGFLIYLLASLYFSNAEVKAIEEAKSRVSEIKGIIDSFEEGNLTGEVYAMTPNDWGLFSFNQGEKKPNACAGVNCICFCEVVYDVFDRQFGKCDDQNVCLVNERLLEFADIEFEDGGMTSIRVSQEGARIKVSKI